MAHYELRAWALSSNGADDDADYVTVAGEYPDGEEGLSAASGALVELLRDGALLLRACLETGIAARDVSGIGAGVFRVDGRSVTREASKSFSQDADGSWRAVA